MPTLMSGILLTALSGGLVISVSPCSSLMAMAMMMMFLDQNILELIFFLFLDVTVEAKKRLSSLPQRAWRGHSTQGAFPGNGRANTCLDPTPPEIQRDWGSLENEGMDE